MGEVEARLSQGQEAMEHFEFCDRLNKIIPGHESQHMAEAIVTSLPLDGGWVRSISTYARERHELTRPLRRARLLTRPGR